MGKSTTAIVPASEYAIVSSDAAEIQQMMAEAFEGTQLSLGLFDFVKIPSGAAKFFELPSADGPQPSATFDGIVIAKSDYRGYWPKSVEDGGNEPPSCSGELIPVGNGKAWRGVGVRFEGDTEGPHDCNICQNNKFGSALKGAGKACPERRLCAVILPHSLLPVILQVPPTSLQALNKYTMGLVAQHRVPLHGAITRFSLVEESSKSGTKYSALRLEFVSALDRETRDKMKAFGEQFVPVLSRMRVDETAVAPGSSFADDGMEDVQ